MSTKDNPSNSNGKFLNPTPILDDLEKGPWPSFLTGFKKLAERTKKTMIRGVLDQLEYSYKTKMGYWKGGLVSVVGYGAGIITRYSLIQDKIPEAKEFHTMRLQPPPGLHYNTKMLRELCDIWEKHGSGIVCMHGQTGDLMLQGVPEQNVQECFDELNRKGWDLGGAGASVRTGASCVGPARCDDSCYDTLKVHYEVLKHFTGLVHRPEFPYKLKFKFAGCPNDCVNSIMRSDIAFIGTFRDAIKVDNAEVKNWVQKNGMDSLVNNVINRCPTKAITLKGEGIEIEDKDCVRCMHCINVMSKALSIGSDKGLSLLMGGKSHLKVGSMLGSMIVPFVKAETDEDIENLIELLERIIEWWDDNAFDHERLGETIERVSLKEFLKGVELEPDINMVNTPRDNPYFKAEF
ncbi:MAG: dissimilatory-type sulfite reductase subunit alpha [Deltaproteobacteria bacterium]|nr:dissimilatory-type sulfite reductase subunit alpha [Deltaproteobacteria bacterium]